MKLRIIDPATLRCYCCVGRGIEDFLVLRKFKLGASCQVSCLKHRFSSNFEKYEGKLNLSASAGYFTGRVSRDWGSRTTLVSTGDIAYF